MFASLAFHVLCPGYLSIAFHRRNPFGFGWSPSSALLPLFFLGGVPLLKWTTAKVGTLI